MTGIARKTRTLDGVAPNAIPYDALMEAQEPVVLKGVARDWPLVRHGMESPQRAMEYLTSFYEGRPVVGYIGAPEIRGRFFYNEDATALNFEASQVRLDAFVERIRNHLDDAEAPSFYIGSTDADIYLPGLRKENDLVLDHPMFARNPPLVGLWIGNRTVAAAHYDYSNNIACCLVGRRRFTLFPPEQIANLYPGPLEPTPGGQVVSMVDFSAPDFERYPRFEEALAAGEIAELEPGDILFYPAMWWHQVEALAPFNVMMNYWWNVSPAFMDTPQITLMHALLSLRDRPETEKRAWRAVFDYYVFGPPERAGAHLPERARGPLAPLDAHAARRLRAWLLNRLNR
ncbi:MAG: cupin-like domain-containing protein [Amphiplicatus sp.]